MSFCPFCKESRADDLEYCDVCGTRLESDLVGREASPPTISEAIVEAPPPIPGLPPSPSFAVADARDVEALEEVDAEVSQPHFGEASTHPTPLPELNPPALVSVEPSRTGPSFSRPAERPSPPPPVAPPAEVFDPEARAAYEKVVAGVETHLEQGFEMFGLVGHPGSGKTHFLKALTYLLRDHGVGSQDAQIEFQKGPAPGPTEVRAFEYAYSGPRDEKWMFVDAGGELFVRLRDNDWDNPESIALTHRLHHCRGLFMFLHLDRGHFGQRWVDLDPELHAEGSEAAERKVSRARQAQQELEFFRQFLLFLRALKFENGNLAKLVELCKDAPTLEKALRPYQTAAPRLDIPVMFFFTQADTYEEYGFEIADGRHLAPRRLALDLAPFVARYLPDLFASLLSQVRRFKFDFLQSYEEHVTDVLDARGLPISEVHWSTDDETLLSVGLLAGVEMVLRNRPNNDGWWRYPGIDTRQALRLHRLLNPKQWQGVKVDLGSGPMRRKGSAA